MRNRIAWSVLVVFACAVSAFAQNKVTFDNQSGETALVKLIGPAAREVEVPTGDKRTVEVAAGRYTMKARYGQAGAYWYSKGDDFDVTETATTYAQITITLHKVVGGNYGTHTISEKEFGDVALRLPADTVARGTDHAAAGAWPKFSAKERSAVDLLGNCMAVMVENRESWPLDQASGHLKSLDEASAKAKALLEGKRLSQGFEQAVKEVGELNSSFRVYAICDSNPDIERITQVLGHECDQINKKGYLGTIRPPAPGVTTTMVWVQPDETKSNMYAEVKPITWYCFGGLEFGVVEEKARVVRANYAITPQGVERAKGGDSPHSGAAVKSPVPKVEQDALVSLPKIRTAFQSRAANSGRILATTDSGGLIPTVYADMEKLAVYRMSDSAKNPPVVELKSIKCDVELKVDHMTLSGTVEGKVAIIDSGLPNNVRADCRTVAAQALGAGNCLDLRGRFDGFYLIIFDDSGAAVRTHCLICTNPGSRLQSDSYRIVPATVTVKGAAASQSLPSEVIYVEPRSAY